jgi:transposase-like protein DUF772
MIGIGLDETTIDRHVLALHQSGLDTTGDELVEELRMHLAWRWFTGLGFDQEIPHHSMFSKNRHGRFQKSKLFQELFEEKSSAFSRRTVSSTRT